MKRKSPEMGHSESFRDAEWLAGQILDWVFSPHELPEVAHFDLVGSRVAIAMLREPVGRRAGDRGLSFTFGKTGRETSGISGGNAESALKASADEDRVLRVDQLTRGSLDKPRKLRMGVRKALQHARDPKRLEPCPTAAQYRFVVVDRRTSKEELTLQLLIVLSQWDLPGFNQDLNQEDVRTLINYLCGLFRHPRTFVEAAKKALSQLATNWVWPSNWRSFRAYASAIVWVHYAKEKFSAIDLAEAEIEQAKRGKRRRRTHATHFSVPELARAAGVDLRRIYEAIKAGKLPAKKIGQSLRIDNETANQFIVEAGQQRKIDGLRKRLRELGQNKEAVRKRLYRLRRAGARGNKIIECLTQDTVRHMLPQFSAAGVRILRLILDQGDTPILALSHPQFRDETYPTLDRALNLHLVQLSGSDQNAILSIGPELKAALRFVLDEREHPQGTRRPPRRLHTRCSGPQESRRP
jgi:hypothetical protein